MNIKRSSKLDDGVCVWFDNGWYYAHGIQKIGEKEDGVRMDSMWAWINHMRHKRWWNSELEKYFIKEVTRYFI